MPNKEKNHEPNPQIGLDGEQSGHAARLAMEMAQQLSFLAQLLDCGTCSPSSVKTHLQLARSQYQDLSAALGGKDVLDQEHEELAAMLREANGKLARLEQAAGEKASHDAVMAGFKALCDAFDSWYTLCGFHYASCGYSQHGVQADFSSELEYYENDEERAAGCFGDKALKSALVLCQPCLDPDGLDLRVDGTRMELLDTEHNKKALTALVKASFPDARITGFKSMLDQNDYLLRFTLSVSWREVHAWKSAMLEKAKRECPQRCRTGDKYLEMLDLRSKLASRTWKKYAGPALIKETKERLSALESLTAKYSRIAAMPDGREKDNLLAAFLLQNGLDEAKDLKGGLYG